MPAPAFDPGKFVEAIVGLGAELSAVRMPDGTGKIHRSYRWNAPKAQIDALWDKEMTSPERCHAVAEFLLKRQG